MSNALFSYDIQTYNRNFLNCAQRQSIVKLKQDGLAVDWLFYTAQVSTDRIREFSLVEQQPKYDFSYEGLTDADFKVIGVTRENHFADRFADAKPHLLNAIERDGFVLSSCNLFFVPHRPEYYQKTDVLHFHTLTSYHPEDDTWSAIDDNSAGILAYFTFDGAFLENIYDQGISRTYRSFTVRQRDPMDVRVEIETLFRHHRDGRSDSLHLLKDIEAHIVIEPGRLKMLAEAFSLLSGSRQCFAQYLRLADAGEGWIELAENIGREAARIRDAFTMGQVSGKVNVDNIRRRALAVAQMETQLGTLR